MTPHPQKAVGLKLFPIFVNSAHIPNFGHLTSLPFVWDEELIRRLTFGTILSKVIVHKLTFI